MTGLLLVLATFGGGAWIACKESTPTAFDVVAGLVLAIEALALTGTLGALPAVVAVPLGELALVLAFAGGVRLARWEVQRQGRRSRR